MLFRRKNPAAKIALPPLSVCDPNTVALAASLKQLPEKNFAQLAERVLQVCDELLEGGANKTQWVAALQVLQPHITIAAEGMATNEPSEIKRQENYRLQLRFFSTVGQLLGKNAANFVNVANKRNSPVSTSQNYYCQAIKFLARSLLLSAKLYDTPAEGCWSTIHNGYQALQKLDNKDDPTNALAYYKAIVALYALSPSQCDLKTLDLLFSCLVKHNDQIELNKKPGKQCLAVLTANEDNPPSMYRVNNDSKPARGSLYISISQLNEICANEPRYQIVQEHLLKVLGVNAKRDTERDEGVSAFNICAGIFAIHKKLSGLASFDDYILNYPGTVAQRVPTFAEKKSIQSYKPNDIWSTPYKTDWSKFMDPQNAAVNVELTAATPSADQTYLKQDVTCVDAINCSHFGLCVHGHSQPLHSYTPGTLLGVQKNTENNWSVASVRWTRADMQQRQLGIEIIGQSASPCAVKIVHSKHGTDAMPALYIRADATKAALLSKVNADFDGASQEQDQHEDWLLFPGTSLSNKTSALLLMDEKIQRIILSKCIEQTSEYCVYALNLVDSDNGT